MINLKHFISKLKRVDNKDYLQFCKLPFAFLLSIFVRMRRKNLWIICEDAYEARDNGYWFFKYVREKHPEQDIVYAINRKSVDYDKVSSIGETVQYGSLKHWVLYLASKKQISSQKAGNPNAALFYFLEVFGILNNNRIFLQHGVIKDDLKWLYYDVTKMKRFICGAYPEYKYVDEKFGYPKGYVKYTGLCRFDGLYDFEADKKLILIMPTWREWIADEDYRLKEIEGTNIIPETRYFRTWVDFILDDRIKRYSESYNVKFIFFPHRNMQKYIKYFPESNQFIEIASAKQYDVQALLKSASMMITDYSSVFFDMLYMKKPVIYYQFDYEIFRKSQYGEGYFDYNNNQFAKSYRDKDAVFEKIQNYIANNFEVDSNYLEAHKYYFKLYDTNNCSRVYEVVNNI